MRFNSASIHVSASGSSATSGKQIALHGMIDCRTNESKSGDMCRRARFGSRIETIRHAVALTVAVGRKDLGMRCARRHIDCIFLSSRHSLESRILLDRQCSMENIALNDRSTI